MSNFYIVLNIFTKIWLILKIWGQILMFDSVNGRTCLHHAAYHGHSDCVEVILSAARSSQVAASW